MSELVVGMTLYGKHTREKHIVTKVTPKKFSLDNGKLISKDRVEYDYEMEYLDAWKRWDESMELARKVKNEADGLSFYYAHNHTKEEKMKALELIKQLKELGYEK